MAAHVLRRATGQPDKVALTIMQKGKAEELTYGALAKRVYDIAGALRARGISDGAPVLLRLGNTVEFPLVFLGCIAAGLVPVVTSAQLTQPEITKMSAQVAPVLIVSEAGLSLPDPMPCKMCAPGDLTGVAPAMPSPGDPSGPAYIVFTSGTSGVPRPVLHAHRALWARGMMIDGWYGLRSDDRVLHAGAFNWTYTLGCGLLDPWSVGATALIPAAGTPPTDLPTLIAQYRASIFAAAPGVYRQMLRGVVPPCPALRHGLSAGEKMAPSLHSAVSTAMGVQVHEAFGMSECSTFISGSPARPAPADTLGFAQAGRRVAILGSDGQPVPRNTPGVIAIGADDPGLMLGYVAAPNETKARFTPDHAWFLTGDWGAMGPDGAISYLGRHDDMMNAGGYRLSPLEVETALTAHPDVTEAAAFEVALGPGKTTIALAYTATAPCSKVDLEAFAAARLARYKVPRLFLHVAALPRGANGKILRRQLRQDFEDSNGQA
ncbi:long-chain fatty acid--CoA ligase [Meridianimarinicoccus aquatilis]|uniref:Long-chain fatty acid--CoA ligase n=2 Tax=Meridianimarinicoccus aquatilis TaxID=2552766 RepID=A0A4R6B3J8_9RHOB|nr:class I adenylate-forming enzyme family protein [Fluviibacterium aquatile]TDL89516.1 long-chain fatty acid--CoA ligase [Fluviibacterium aquatile]